MVERQRNPVWRTRKPLGPPGKTAGFSQSRNRRLAVTVPVASGVEARYGSAISFHLRTGLLYDDGPFRDLQANVLCKLLR